MNTLQARQDPQAVLDYTVDWTKMLAANGSVLISSATVTPSAGVVSNVSHDTGSVTFRLTPTGVTAPATILVRVHVVLSSGEEDERTLTVEIMDL